MRKVSLGREGLTVPAVGLGCMGMSEFYGESNDRENHAVLDRSLEIGCNFWDTADMYGPWKNEYLLGEALRGRRDKVILATKFGIKRDAQQAWLGVDGRPEYVRMACDASLQRLQTDYIDVYYQHRVDPETPIEETVGAMAELVAQGKVRYLGLSEASPDIIERAHKTHPISVVQTEYSLWSREVEADILPTLRRLGIGFVAYSPLGRGFLTGSIGSQDDLDEDDWRRTNPRFTPAAIEANARLVERVRALAEEKGVQPAQIALAWVLAAGDDIATIPGTRRIRYLEQNVEAEAIELSAEELNALDGLKSLEVVGTRY